MSLCRSIPVVRTAANRGISIRTVSAARACRNFQTSSICSNKPKDHEGKSSRKTSDERLNDEIKKLKEMRESFRDSGFLEKFKLRDQLQKQETKVAETQSFKKIDEDVKPPIIKFGESDPLKADVAERYAVVYKYMLGLFLIQCSNSTSLFVDPDDVIQETITSFEETYPYLTAITKEEVLSLTHLYYALLNNIVYLDDLKIENPIVTELLQEYLKFVDNSEDSSLDAFPSKEIAVKHNVEKAIVVNWFKTFDIWNECPYSDENFRYTNILCPFEYSQYEGVKNELKRVADELTMNKKGDQPNAFGNFTFNTSNENKSKNSEKSSEKKKEDDKNKSFYEVEFNIPPAAKFFQIGVLGGLLIYILCSNNLSNEHEITFQEFVTKFLSKGLVSKIVVVNNRVAIVELNENGKNQMNYYGNYSFTIGSVESFERSLREAQDEYNISDLMRIPVVFTSEGGMSKLLINFVPTFIFLGAIYYMTKKAGGMGGMGGPLGFGKSSAKKFNSEAEVKVRFKDVAGMSEAKEEVMEFVKFLKNPTKYEHLGAKIPRGAILSGPPGTGKTLIARATAGEAGVPFYSVSGSEFVEMFVGVGALRVRDLFKTARENAPSIIFIDEIDAIGKQRSKGNASGANDERETTLNQLLVEMDGFDTSDHVVVLAGTNRADILDKALMRPGRFDRHITIDNPELEGRKEIFEVHLKKITLSPDIDAQLSGRLAALTPGFSGADIANVCNEAALIAARYNAESVTLRHFELAIERVIGGIEKKSKILNPEEQRIVAYHEAGHAICGWYLRYANPLLKVSIIPRGQGALGYAQYLPPDQYLMNTFQLSDRMIMTLGGRVSEQLHFASVTSGAHDDFKKVTNIARLMVLRFGMSPKVGMVNYADAKTSDDLTKPFSDQTNRTIDEEIQRIVKESYDKCTALLKEKAAEVELVAQELLRKEFITREDMIRLLGKRPFPETNDAFDKYLDGKAAYSNEVPVNEKKDSEIEEERKHTEQEEEKANKKEA